MFQAFRTTGHLASIDDEPYYTVRTRTLLASSNDPKEIVRVIPSDWYADRRAGHIVFSNMPEPMWDVDYEHMIVEADADGEIDALFQAYNKRSL